MSQGLWNGISGILNVIQWLTLLSWRLISLFFCKCFSCSSYSWCSFRGFIYILHKALQKYSHCQVLTCAKFVVWFLGFYCFCLVWRLKKIGTNVSVWLWDQVHGCWNPCQQLCVCVCVFGKLALWSTVYVRCNLRFFPTQIYCRQTHKHTHRASQHGYMIQIHAVAPDSEAFRSAGCWPPLLLLLSLFLHLWKQRGISVQVCVDVWSCAQPMTLSFVHVRGTGSLRNAIEKH